MHLVSNYFVRSKAAEAIQTKSETLIDKIIEKSVQTSEYEGNLKLYGYDTSIPFMTHVKDMNERLWMKVEAIQAETKTLRVQDVDGVTVSVIEEKITQLENELASSKDQFAVHEVDIKKTFVPPQRSSSD